ncbi:MAG: signal peptidase II [Candidatus Cloacimonetes bacterium]|nr:signal peptidase II [Candidatus Cloacimonadota bacterium]
MKKNSSYIKSYMIAIFSVVILAVFDQYTKKMAQIHLKDQNPFIIVKNIFQLHYLENRGAAFGILQNQKIFFVISAILIILVIGFLYHKMPLSAKYIPLRICSILICSGAIGNMIDRVRLNYVVDFFYFELIDFPIFNVADIYVVAACILFAVLILFYYKEEDLSCFSLKRL